MLSKCIVEQLSRMSFLFDLPIKTRILLYDEVHASILRETIKRDFNILYLRKKKNLVKITRMAENGKVLKTIKISVKLND